MICRNFSAFILSFSLTPLLAGEKAWNGSFNAENWVKEWKIRPSKHFGLKNAQVIHSKSEASFLRISFPKGSATRSLSRKENLPEGGAQFLTTVPVFPKGGVEEATLTYSVRFAKGFDFVKGGKLPGLFGGKRISGKDYPTGDDGFSTRLHWRANGDGQIKAYLPVKGGSAPEFGTRSFRFQPGKWHNIRQKVVFNNPRQANGRLQMWFDGKLVINEKKILYRTGSQLRIEGLFFCTFFGGGTREWASTQDTFADFRNFSVTTP